MNTIFRPAFAVLAILIAVSLAKAETKIVDPAAAPAYPIENPKPAKPVVKPAPAPAKPAATPAPAKPAVTTAPTATASVVPIPRPRPAIPETKPATPAVTPVATTTPTTPVAKPEDAKPTNTPVAKPEETKSTTTPAKPTTMGGSIFDKMTGEGEDAKKVVDVMAESGVNKAALKLALDYFDANQVKFTNRRYITLIDYSKSSVEQRMYVFEVKTGKVAKYLVAHGMGSGGLKANNFSNTGSSGTSSLGFYKAAETYVGKHGRSLRLDGLSKTNSNARRRAVVIHAAGYIRLGRQKVAYVSPEMVKLQGRLGRSQGCPALDPRYAQIVIEELKGGSLIYAFNK